MAENNTHSTIPPYIGTVRHGLVGHSMPVGEPYVEVVPQVVGGAVIYAKHGVAGYIVLDLLDDGSVRWRRDEQEESDELKNSTAPMPEEIEDPRDDLKNDAAAFWGTSKNGAYSLPERLSAAQAALQKMSQLIPDWDE